MQCTECQRSVVMGHDHGEAPSSEAAAHLESCGNCREFSRNLQGLDRLLLTDAPDEVRPGFDTRFFARLQEQKKRPASRWRFWHVLAPLTGAVAAGVVGVMLLAGPEEQLDPGDDLGIAMHLELLEDLEVVTHLEDAEAFELLAQLNEDELETLLTGEETP